MASSSPSIQHKHDVFLSFRGEDTRYNFTSHLYAALQRKEIEAFIDVELRRGEEISPALLKAIEESKISIIIFSENYASSSWCLNELCKILECEKTNGQIVVPIFYHVDPSDVRKQTGSFAEAFDKHEEHLKERIDKVQRWRDALEEIGNLSGWHFQKDRSEYELIEEIVKDISKKLKSINKSSNDYRGLVGLNSRIKQIESLLCINKVDVRIVGIWGMGGIGKTTLAEAVFNKNFARFEACCFLANVREELKKPGGEVHLWEKLLSTILKERKLCIGTRLLPNFIRDRLSRKKAFIVLDDVNDSLQLDLLREKHCFGPGSEIIVTSRDKQVLQQFVDEDDIYEVKELIDDEALQLFCLNAFKQKHPMKDWMELSKKVIDYAKGVPLALKVLGSVLYGKSKQEWESELNKLKQIANPKIHNLLKISYDGLDIEVKDMFLDIACFFRGKNKDYVAKILDSCYFAVHSGISVLIDKSLITISETKLEIHDLIQEMGWNIVREESIKEPGKRSRLWNPDDVYYVLKNNSGTEAIEGIFLDMSKIKEVHLSRATFARMYKLRLLKFYYSGFKRDPKVYLSQKAVECLSDNLCYLHWDEYPLKSLPSNFCPESLVELNMTHSHVERLWNGVQNLVKLKSLDLSYSQHLIEIPDLSHATNLGGMTLKGCTSLVEVPSSIRYLNEIRYLRLEDCENLRNLPNISHLRSLQTLVLSGCSNITKFPEVPRELAELCLKGTAIEEVPSSVGCLSRLDYLNLENCKHLESLPSSFCKLKSLEYISLSGCSKLKSFPEILETMEGLKYLYLDISGIEELPSSIEYLINLDTLDLGNIKNLKNLPSILKNLKSINILYLDHCNLLEFPSCLTCLSSLRELYLTGNNFESIPPSIKQLSVLEKLYLSYSERLQSIPELPSSLCLLKAHHCTALEGVSLTEFIKVKDWVSDFDKFREFTFINCLKLDQLAMGSIGKEAQLRSQQVANVHVDIYHEAFWSRVDEEYQLPSLIICFPGSEIPEWFAYQSSGSTINTLLDQRWHDCKFVGFTLGVVIARDEDNGDSYLRNICHCRFNTDPLPVFFSYFLSDTWQTPIGSVDSDHVLLSYNILFNSYLFGKFQSNDVSFDFQVVDIDGNRVDYCKVKKCGVHLWYGPTETGSGSSDLLNAQDRECNPNHDPTQLSFKCGVVNQAFGEEDGAVAKRCRDDCCYNEATPSKNPSSNEEEEEEEPFPKDLNNTNSFDGDGTQHISTQRNLSC